MPYYHAEIEQRPVPAVSGWQEGHAHFRAFVITMCLLLMGGVLGLNWIKQTIKNELPSRIITEVNSRLANSHFVFDLGDARWTEGSGLSLSNVRFADRRTGQVVIACQEVFAHSTFQLTDVLDGLPTIDLLSVEQLELQCLTDAEGVWNIQQLFESLQDCESSIPIDCPIQIRDAMLAVDCRPFGLNEIISLRDIQCEYTRPLVGSGIHFLKGCLSSDFNDRMNFEFELNRESGIWTANCGAGLIEINERWTDMLERRIQDSPLVDSLRGQIAINAAATGRLGESNSVRYSVAGRASNLQCLDRSLPHPLLNGSFEFRVDNEKNNLPRLLIQNARLGLGYGNVTGQAVIHDLFRQPQWRATGQLKGLEITGRLLPWLKPELQRLWHQYQPGGVIDADFDIQNVDGKLSKNIRARIKDGSFSWYRFPYPMSQCNGIVEWIGDELAVTLTAVEAQQTIDIRGEITNPGPYWKGWLECSCDGLLPINEKMFQAFDNKPALARTLRRFHATGHINGRGRIERADGNADLKRDFNIQLQQATVRHENFDYPIYNVGGTIRVVNDVTEFRSFAGQNNNGQIQCEGVWTPQDGLQLGFLASNVLLNDELRLALPANLRKTWDGLRPAGTIDLVDLDLRYPVGAVTPIVSAKIDVTGQRDHVSSVSINPIWFPYEMRQVTGSFGFKDQNVNINNFAAKHGDTDIRTNGNGRYDETSWNLRFSEMFVRDIELDDELRRALPASIAQAADQVGFSGNIGMRGALVLNGSFQPTPPSSAYVSARDPQVPSANLQWQLEFGITRAAVNIGLPLTDISGLMKLNGRYAAGKTESLGQLQVDSMMYHDIQVTAATIPFSIDDQKIGIGRKLRRNGELVNDRPASGQLFGGRVQCDAEISLQDLNQFIINANLVGGDVEKFASEISLAQHDFSGEASAAINLRGNSSGTHSLEGNGSITLQDAKIYEVPVIVALFNVLRIKEPDRTAFDKATMSFAVRGENFDIKPIELNGDAISLIGEGTIDLDSNVDLNFYSLIGRNGFEIPIITDLYKAGSKQVWWIKVAGTLQDPVTEHEVLPGLNDSLKMLFPELAEADQ